MKSYTFKKTILSLAMASTCLPASSVFAYSATPAAKEGQVASETEMILVIGKKPRNVQDVVGAVSVINSDTIDNILAHDMESLFRYQAGINVINSGSRFGDSSIAIRGISGNRVATEIDGIPVADQFSVGSYANSGRNHIDPDLIKQVEVLRGPASSTYGSDAIGGVISFVTKSPLDLLSETNNNVYVDVKSSVHSIDQSRSASVNSAFAVGKSSILLSGSLRKGHERDINTSKGIEALLQGQDTQDNAAQSLLAKYYYDISDDQSLTFSYDYYRRDSQSDTKAMLGLDRFSSTTLLLGDDDTKRQNFQASYEFMSDFSWLSGGNVRLYHQTTSTSQLTTEERTSRGKAYLYNRDFYYDQKVKGLRFNAYANIEHVEMSHQLGYGIEVSRSETIESRDGLQTTLSTGATTNVILSEEFPVRDFPISEVEEVGVYFNDEITFTDLPITIIPAIRYDHYKLTPLPDTTYLEDNPTTTIVNINEDRISPKLSILYQTSERSKVYLQYVKGFRAPPFEDANIGLDIAMMKMRAIPNPDLKSEVSDGYEIGFNYRGEQHQLDLVGFYNDYKDFIQTKVNLGFNPSVGRIIFQSQNIDRTKIYGAELNYKGVLNHLVPSGNAFNVYASLFWSKGKNKKTNQSLNEISPNSMVLGAQWVNAQETMALNVNANVVDAKTDGTNSDVKLAKTAGYATIDVVANVYFNKQLSLSAGVYNLTDRQYWQWSNVQGFEATDPLLASLVSAGINGSVQLKYKW